MITYVLRQLPLNSGRLFRTFNKGKDSIDPDSEYVNVYQGTISGSLSEPEDVIEGYLDKLFTFFQRGCSKNLPASFAGHSMSVSDIITMMDNGKMVSFYCNPNDWVKLDN